MDEYVPKPISSEQLFVVIESLCDREASAAASPGAGESQPSPCSDGHNGDTIDWAGALHSVNGDRGALRAMVDAAVDEMPRLLAAMHKAVDDSDAAALRRAAHTLKAAVGYFSHGPALEHLQLLEQSGQQGQWAGMREAIDALDREVEKLVAALRVCQPVTA